MLKDEFLYKVLILGDGQVGKTSFLTRYVDNFFLESTLSTTGVDYRLKNVEIEDGSTIKLQIWDTVGQERFNSIARSYYKGVHAIILIFSVTDRKSFDNVQNWLNQIKEEVDEQVTLILVANKIDCENREVDSDEGEELANEFNIKFFECSAKTGRNIDLAFDELIKKMVKIVDKTKDKKIIINQEKPDNIKKGNSCCKKKVKK